MARRKAKPNPADMDRLDWLKSEFAVVCDEVATMISKESFQAAMAGRRIMLTLRKELDEAKAAAADEGDFDPEDLDSIVAEVLHLPDKVFRHPDIRARIKRLR